MEKPMRVGQSEMDNKVEGIKFLSSEKGMRMNNIRCCYEDEPDPFKQPDFCRRRDGVRWLQISFLFDQLLLLTGLLG